MAATRDQVDTSVVHVAVAESPYRVDSTTHLLHGSADGDVVTTSSGGGPRTVWNATTANCDGADPAGCRPPQDSSTFGLPAVSPRRPDVVAAFSCVDSKTNAGSRTSAVNPRDLTTAVLDASPIPVGGGGSGGDTVTDDMVTFRAALDAVDASAFVGGLRRVRSKSVLVPVCRPPPAAVRLRSRGSVPFQCEQLTHDDEEVDLGDDDVTRQHPYQRLFQQQQQPAKTVQTSMSYRTEWIRSASLATRGSRRSRDSASMSDMCLEYMRLNGIVPRYPSLQQQHDDAIVRSAFSSCY